MTETDWLSCSNPRDLLEATLPRSLCSTCRGRSHHGCPTCRSVSVRRKCTPRKLRLVACACCRFMWEDLTGDPSRAAVEVAERFAEERASARELARALLSATAPAAAAAALPNPTEAALEAIRHTLDRLSALHKAEQSRDLMSQLPSALSDAGHAAERVGPAAVKAVGKLVERWLRQQLSDELSRYRSHDARELCEVIRDLFGNPYHLVLLDPRWLDANGGLVRGIAQDIDLHGRFDELPVLADALEEAGCADAGILEHARSRSHYRGCWLLDAILNKE